MVKLLGVGFDIGGILADDINGPLSLEVARKYGLSEVEVGQAIDRIYRQYDIEPVPEGLSWQGIEVEFWERLNTSFPRLKTVPVDELIQLSDQFIVQIDEMVPILERLRANGIKLAICSNNCPFFWGRMEQKLDFPKYFDPANVILSCNVGARKSSRGFEMFKALANALDLDTMGCVFFDDKEGNIECATKFGIPSVLVPGGWIYGSRYINNILFLMGV